MFICERGLRLNRGRWVAVTGLVLILGGLVPPASAATPNLVQSTLVNGSQFASRPFRVVLTFAEPVERVGVALSRGTVDVALNPPTAGSSDREAYLDIAALAPGSYSLRWTATGTDALTASGVVRFSVIAAATTAPPSSIQTTVPATVTTAAPQSTVDQSTVALSTDALSTDAITTTSRPIQESTVASTVASTELRVPATARTTESTTPPNPRAPGEQTIDATTIGPPVVLTTLPVRTTISPVQIKDPTDPNLVFQPNPGRRTTTIVLAPDGPPGTRSDGSPIEIPLRTRPTATSSPATHPQSSTTNVASTTKQRPARAAKEKGPTRPNRFEGLRSGLGVLAMVTLLAALATSVTRRTPRALRILLLASAIVALTTVGLVSLFGVADELRATPRETIRFTAKLIGALAFLGAAVLRYFLGDRTVPRRQISMHLRTRSTGAGTSGLIDNVMHRFGRIAIGQIVFSLALVASAVLLMSR